MSQKINSSVVVGDCIQYWQSFAVVAAITDRRMHPTVKKECVIFHFENKPAMTAFLDSYSKVRVYEPKT